MLTEEQAKEIKKQIFSQIESWPEEQREAAKKQLETMNTKQLEAFLIKNKMIKPDSKAQGQQQAKVEKQECVFCLIKEGKVPIYKIDENKTAIAALEINPESKGHSIIIPKQHLTADKILTSALSLSKKIAKKVKNKMKAKDVEISTGSMFGHAIVNVVPIYDDKPRERKKADEKELKELQEKLMKRQGKPRKKKTEQEKISKLPKAPLRIP